MSKKIKFILLRSYISFIKLFGDEPMLTNVGLEC